MVEKCRDDAALKVKPDCQNALEAEKDLKVFGKMMMASQCQKSRPD
ncbi:hypothetical protein PSJ59_24210 [Escherichia coli]|nr:hypothetical protein [Escherichia coli]MDC9184888.1 hypothetical protein [Escherichia coli]